MKNTFILGIEGTAWNLSAAIVTETEIIAEVTETYKHSRGIHPGKQPSIMQSTQPAL
ncbi:hypothetical protein [Methanosarcina barkeri]|uniref:hypothetical protein n=1 Tax=Methanosarcina barkeri TaxID=2208 RepID=UPI000AB7455A|nr:hypothetical protein [Methanosarcina barkeri]